MWKIENNLLKDIFESQAYKVAKDYSYRHNISSKTYLEHEESNISKNQKANAQSDFHLKKRERKKKEKDKDLISINDEINEVSWDSKEEWKDPYPSKISEASQDHILNQIELIRIEDRFWNLEKRLLEEINSK